MVAANCTCETSGDTDDKELAAFGEDAAYDGNEDTERTPGRTCGEGKEYRNEEDDGGKEVLETFSRTAHETLNEYVSTEEVCDVLKCCSHCAAQIRATKLPLR